MFLNKVMLESCILLSLLLQPALVLTLVMVLSLRPAALGIPDSFGGGRASGWAGR